MGTSSLNLRSGRARAMLAAAAVALTSSPAAADEPSAALAWGVTVTELATVGVLGMNFGTRRIPKHGPALAFNFAPLLLGPAAAYGAHATELDASPALAIHGAGWLGLELFLLGALIDGRERAWGLRAGPTAWTLGAIGAIAGGVIGATAVDDADQATAWLAAPPGGFVAGGVVLGGILVLAGGVDGDHAPGQFATGALAGLTLGLGAATYLALRGPGDPASTPRVGTGSDPRPRRVMFSFGGTF